MGYTDSKLLGSDEGVKMGSTDGKVIGTILGYANGITLGIDFGTEIGAIEVSYYDSKDVKAEGLLFGGTLGYTHGKVLGSVERIELVLSVVELFGTIFGNVNEITLGIDVGTELGSLDVSFYGYNHGKFERLLLKY